MKETIRPAIQVRAARWGTTALAAVVIAGAAIPVGARPGAAAAAKGSAAAGKKLYASQGCGACHKIGTAGGKVGPDLSKEGTKHRSAQWLVAFMKNPKSQNPKSSMPPVKGSQKELADLAAYMQSLK
jgi:mono/diheme cytochrome c family protein